MDLRGLLRSAQREIPILLEQGRHRDIVQTFLDVTFTALLHHEDRLDRHHRHMRNLCEAFDNHEQNVERSVREVANNVAPAVAEKIEEL
eukprot:1655116-Karenia_brevis.AAC.1